MAGYLEGQTVKKSETEMDDILVYMQMSSVLSVAADWETKKKTSKICHKMIGRFKINIFRCEKSKIDIDERETIHACNNL